MRARILLGVVVAAVVGGASQAQAQCPVNSFCYFGQDATGDASTRSANVNAAAARNDFFSTLVGVGTETFEGLTGASPLTLNFGIAGNATLNGTGAVVTQGAGTDGNGRYPSSGVNYYEATSASGGGQTFSVSFDNPVAAFGFYGIDIGDFGSQLSLVFTLAAGGTRTWTLPYTAGGILDGSILYSGFVSNDLFTSVEFRGTSSNDVFAFDDMSVGSQQQVLTTSPEPASLALMITGFVGIGAQVRRRRKQNQA
jgi:hypothetical protein